MNKLETTMVLGAAAAIALAGFSAYDSMVHTSPRMEHPVRMARVDFPEPMPMTVDEEFGTLLPTLISDDPNVRKTGLAALSIAFDKGAQAELSPRMLAETATALIELYDEEKGDAPGGARNKAEAMRILVSQVRSEGARDFAVDILRGDDSEMKTALLKTLVQTRIEDKEVREAAYGAVSTEGVPQWLKPSVIRRTQGKEADKKIAALMESTEDQETLRHCAVEIQNMHQPDLLGPVLSRLEAVGLLQDVKVLPWFSGRLLAKHIEKADDDELLRALRVVWLRPALTRTTMKSVEGRLAHADPGIRRLVARLIPDAVKNEGLGYDKGEELLAAALQIETDPAVKGELEGSLTAVRQTRRTTPRMEESSGPGE